MHFHLVEENLRQSFRVLANGRPRAAMLDISGISIVSLGVAFQMFNAAFLNAPVETQPDLEARLQTSEGHFASPSIPWSLWVFEDWLTPGVRKKLSRGCELFGLRLSSELPGMLAENIEAAVRPLPRLDGAILRGLPPDIAVGGAGLVFRGTCRVSPG